MEPSVNDLMWIVGIQLKRKSVARKIKRMEKTDIHRIAEIDRPEHVTLS